MNHLIAPIILMVVSLVTIVLVAPTPSSGFIAAFYAPWWSGARALLAASRAGPIVASGRLAFVVVIAAEGPDSIGRLARSGAWFTFDPLLFGMCGTPTNQRRP